MARLRILAGGAIRGKGGSCVATTPCHPPFPLSHSASLLQGIGTGDPWSAHVGDVAALTAVFVVSVAVSSRVFRWE